MYAPAPTNAFQSLVQSAPGAASSTAPVPPPPQQPGINGSDNNAEGSPEGDDGAGGSGGCGSAASVADVSGPEARARRVAAATAAAGSGGRMQRQRRCIELCHPRYLMLFDRVKQSYNYSRNADVMKALLAWARSDVGRFHLGLHGADMVVMRREPGAVTAQETDMVLSSVSSAALPHLRHEAAQDASASAARAEHGAASEAGEIDGSGHVPSHELSSSNRVSEVVFHVRIPELAVDTTLEPMSLAPFATIHDVKCAVCRFVPGLRGMPAAGLVMRRADTAAVLSDAHLVSDSLESGTRVLVSGPTDLEHGNDASNPNPDQSDGSGERPAEQQQSPLHEHQHSHPHPHHDDDNQQTQQGMRVSPLPPQESEDGAA